MVNPDLVSVDGGRAAGGPRRPKRRFGRRVSRVTEVPAGRMVELPGRGTTYLVDIPGPMDAPTVFLLHGVVTTAMLNWFPALEELSQHYRVVLYDQRWHGHGIRSPQWKLDDLADDVVAVADLLGVEKPILAGYSMGGVVAQLAAHRNPDRFGGIVLCATTYRFQEKWRERAFHRAMGTMMGGLSQTVTRRVALAARRLPEVPLSTWDTGRMDRWAMAELRSTSGWAIAQAIAELGRFDSSAWLPSVQVPAAVVITTHDRALPVYRQLEMAKLIPGAEIFLARAGHAACALEADVFVPVLLDACAAVAARQ
ncbi:alpha/beta fold hydrolase [Nocardia mexicana]|uniref:Pimeloyl-ACP methyl ester carboxylesterase n=1 Tax=Nocardia mexicana TaxID=279262 RepID=A0A370HF16_9NOCA|nr:alpha/beta hydrolase [Nocardia mexicana]RDI55831.1 pimeloyl-ACP methyl ester carboxylesterase [Nocardia mexicana]